MSSKTTSIRGQGPATICKRYSAYLCSYSYFMCFIVLVFFTISLTHCAAHAMGGPIAIERDYDTTGEEQMPKTPWADKYFSQKGDQLYTLTKKIELKQPITVEEVKALPDGALNKRYAADITLLFFALNAFNAQAIDVLLEAGADPYMVDSPKTGSKRDFTYYFALYDKNDKERYTGAFVNSNIKSYLKHGGDPNHVLDYTVAALVALSENYEGTKLLVDAGADVLAEGNDEGSSAADILARASFPEGEQLLNEFIDKGYLSDKAIQRIKDLINYLAPKGRRGREVSDQRNAWAKLNVEKLLYRYPEILDGEAPDSFLNKRLQYIFDGPVPWKEILSKNFTDPKTGKRKGEGK